MDEISKEKLAWMKEVGIREFERPMKYYLGGNQLFPEEYIKNTSLKELKERHKKYIARINFDEEFKTEEDF